MGWVALERGGAVFALAAVLASTNCTSSARSSERENFCQRDCQRWVWCLSLGSAQVDPCVNDCLQQPFTKNMQGKVLAGYTDCLNDLGCVDFTDQTERDQCFSEAFEVAPRSRACAEFCEGHTRKSFECGYRASMEDCARGNCGVVDDMLMRAKACAEIDSCEAWESCLNEAFSFE